jgi:competence protein ComEC
MKNKKYIKRAIVSIVLLISLLTVAGCNQKDIGSNSSPGEIITSGMAKESTVTTSTKPSISAKQTTEETPESAHEVSVMFINVGRADATLIQIDSSAYLIDTGEKSSIPALYGALAQCEVEKLDAVFLSHTHGDHIGGMEALAQKYEIGKLYSAEISEDKKDGENKIDNLAAELALDHVKLKAGDKVNLVTDVYFEVLGPLKYNAEDDNNNSLVLKLKVNDKTFLFTGDMEFAEEQTLLSIDTELSADILKVGNHGNPDATSDQFAQAVLPEIAVISTDTAVDDDSANARVKAALKGARILITQDYKCGVLLTVDAKGIIKISDPQAEKSNAKIEILKIDKSTQTVTLKNNGDDIDISGYFIYSERGSEVFVFPEGTMFKAGQTLTVACTGGKGDFIWEDKKVWNAKKDDAGILYDAYGNEVSHKP